MPATRTAGASVDRSAAITSASVASDATVGPPRPAVCGEGVGGREEVEAPEGAAGADEVGHERRRRAGQDVGRGAVLLEPAAFRQHGEVVAEPQRLVDVVGDEHDRLAELLLEAKELVLQPGPGDGIDGAEGLVHQEDRRVGGQRPGHANPLALPAGELVGPAVP